MKRKVEMKTTIIFVIAVLLTAFSVVSTDTTLQEAINKNLVKIKIISLGHFQGESVMIEVKNLTKKSLKIKIEAGRVLIADDPKYQNLLLVKEAEILVNANESVSKKLVGFCCESTDIGPKNELGYKTYKLADSNLVSLTKFININYDLLGASTIQQAIWAISNNHTSAAIQTGCEKEMALKNLVCTLKNEPIPWYTIKQKIYQTPNGRIHLVADSLFGQMMYSNTKWCYSELNIYDLKNNAVLISLRNWLQPGTNAQYKVALSIKQLATGNYKLRLENKSQIFSQKDIRI